MRKDFQKEMARRKRNPNTILVRSTYPTTAPTLTVAGLRSLLEDCNPNQAVVVRVGRATLRTLDDFLSSEGSVLVLNSQEEVQ